MDDFAPEKNDLFLNSKKTNQIQASRHHHLSHLNSCVIFCQIKQPAHQRIYTLIKSSSYFIINPKINFEFI